VLDKLEFMVTIIREEKQNFQPYLGMMVG
jgi:hypothetical protein